jgi:hypothetical protein
MCDTNTSEKKYICECCNYTSLRLFDYEKHLSTNKHLNRQKEKNIIIPVKDSNDNINVISCEFCGKTYKHASSLSRHKSICKQVNTNSILTNENSDKILIMKLINDNKELRNQLLEKSKEHEKMMMKILENVISK